MLTRNLIATLLLCILAAGCVYVMLPFVPALIWSATIVVATWNLMKRIERHVHDSRAIATTIMVGVMAALVIIPVAIASYIIFSRVDDAITWLRDLPQYTLPPAPDWLSKGPLASTKLARDWNDLSAKGPGALANYLQPYLKPTALWLAAAAKSYGLLVVHMILTLALTGVFYAKGEMVAKGLIMFARRIAGDRGEFSIVLAAQSIRAVALGIVVTAVTQTVLGSAGLALAGVPFTPILTAVMFIFCIAQLGPVIPMLAGVAWLYNKDFNTTGTILLAWTLFVGIIDNVLRPLLIKRGADLPLILILAGVIGGLIAFGVVGLFIGPVFLAVTFRLLQAWVGEGEQGAISKTSQGPLVKSDVPQEFIDSPDIHGTPL